VAIATGTRGTFLAVARGRTAESATLSRPDSTGRVLVSANIAGDKEETSAWINQGNFGVKACDVLAEPNHWSCPMLDGDAMAWVNVLAVPKGLFMSRIAAQALVRRSDQGPVQYTSSMLPPRNVSSTEDFVAAIVSGVNERRAIAQLPPLRLAGKQTREDHTRLAPYFFHAQMTADATQTSQLALGLLAGWDVEGTIQTGSLASFLLSGTSDASQWLESALEMPLGRIVFFDRTASQMAVGASTLATLGGLGAIVTTYSLFRQDHTVDADLYFAAINKARAATGLPIATRAAVTEEFAATVGQVQQGKLSTAQALQEAMNRENERTGLTVIGGTSLEAAPLSSNLLASGKLSMMVHSFHYKPEDSPWGHLVVMVLASPVK
jgi:hypothetical protein